MKHWLDEEIRIDDDIGYSYTVSRRIVIKQYILMGIPFVVGALMVIFIAIVASQ